MTTALYPGHDVVFEGHTLSDIAAERVPGLSLLTGFASGEISSMAFKTVWGFDTQYVRPSAEEGFTVVSTSTDDTLAGIGARVVLVPFIHDDGTLETELIKLNGQTPVNSITTSARRVVTPRIVAAGSNEINVGDITITSTSSGSNLAFIEADVGECHDGVRSLSIGFKAFIHGAIVTASENDPVTTRLLIGAFDAPLRERARSISVDQREYVPIEILVDTGHDLVIESKVAAGTVDIQVDPVIIIIEIAKFRSNIL